jgi:peptidoglycan hydrolase CwlO-like protein
MIDYKNYKSYIIVGAVCFALGYLLAGIGAGGRLYDLRIRAEQAESDYQRVRSELQSSQQQLADLQKSIGETGKTASDASKSTDNAKESNRAIGKSVDSVIQEIKSNGSRFDEAKRILSEIQKRGRKGN